MNSYKRINQTKAKKIMDTKDVIVLDVRTEEEFYEEHIPDAVLIPLDTLEFSAESILQNKNSFILVYCRSGKRSIVGAEILTKLGYKNVLEFGGIIDWIYEKVL